MTDDANDDWMKPGPPDPWRVLGWRFLGCVLITTVLALSGRLLQPALGLPEAVVTILIYLPFVLWSASLIAFCRARLWRDPRPLWGRLPLSGPGWAGWSLRVLATTLTVTLGMAVFVLTFSFLGLFILGGIWF